VQTTNGAEALKRAAAERAAEWIRDGMTLGLGTGSTVRHLLDVIAERRAGGEWLRVVGVPTSEDTAARSRALGIPSPRWTSGRRWTSPSTGPTRWTRSCA
jgi:ribose 5-phosphate isomerase